MLFLYNEVRNMESMVVGYQVCSDFDSRHIIVYADELSIATIHTTGMAATQSSTEDIKFVQIIGQYQQAMLCRLNVIFCACIW